MAATIPRAMSYQDKYDENAASRTGSQTIRLTPGPTRPGACTRRAASRWQGLTHGAVKRRAADDDSSALDALAVYPPGFTGRCTSCGHTRNA